MVTKTVALLESLMADSLDALSAALKAATTAERKGYMTAASMAEW